MFYRPDHETLIEVFAQIISEDSNFSVDVTQPHGAEQLNVHPNDLLDYQEGEIDYIVIHDDSAPYLPSVACKLQYDEENNRYYVVENSRNYHPAEYFEEYK